MPYKKYGKAPKRKLRQYRKKGKRMAKKPLRNRPALRATIKDVMYRQVETKYIGHGTDNLQIGSYDVAGGTGMPSRISLGCHDPYMHITQGDKVNERNGNKIKTVSTKIRLIVTPNDYDVSQNPTPQPFFFVIWFLVDRRAVAGAPSYLLPDFYTNGDLDFAPKGTMMDTWYNSNKDKYTVFKKDVLKVGWSQYTGSGTPTGNTFPSVVRRAYDLTKYYPKTVMFDDNSGVPQNRGVYMMCEAVPAQGGYYSGLLAKMSYEQFYKFKDP